MSITCTVHRAETRSIAIAAPPEVVHAYVADPPNLPAWAPAFADAVRPAEDGTWTVASGGAEFAIRLPASAAHGTADIVAAADPRRGAFLRVLPNGDGSELLFTLVFAPGTPAAAIGRQMATVEEELAAVRRVVEG